jgi:hypothetical protein
VTCDSVSDDEGSSGVVETARIDGVVVDGVEALVDVAVKFISSVPFSEGDGEWNWNVLVTSDVEVDVVVVEYRLECLLPDGVRTGTGRGVPRTMKSDNEPRPTSHRQLRLRRRERSNTHVLDRSTALRSATSQSSCWFIVEPKGPLSFPAFWDPPGSPCPRSVSVSRKTMWVIPTSIEYQKLPTPLDSALGIL